MSYDYPFMDHTLEEYFPQPSNETLLVNYFWRIRNMVHSQNKTFLAMFVGRFRSGKSYSACAFADLLDPSFRDDMENRLIYDPQSFLFALKRIRDTGEIGQALVFDEAGVTYSGREWHQFINRTLSKEMQIMAYLRPIIFFVSLDLSFLDSQPRKLLNAVYEVSRSGNDRVNIKPFFLDYDRWSGKFFRHYPIYIGRYDEETLSTIYKIKKIRMKLPPKVIVDKYEEISRSYKDNKLDSFSQDVDAFNNQQLVVNAPEMPLDHYVSSVLKDYVEFETRRSKPSSVILNRDAIKHRFNVTMSKAIAIKQLVENKLNS